MKKLIALLALVCVVLMPFSAMAEEKTAIEWAASEMLIADTDLTGDFYNIDEMGLKIWLPDELNAVEVTEEETASGVYAKLTDKEQTCVLTIYALHVDGMTLDQAYQNAVEGGMKEPEIVTINGLDAVTYEAEETNEGAIVLVDTNDNMIFFTFSPINDEGAKMIFYIIASSIMPLE